MPARISSGPTNSTWACGIRHMPSWVNSDAKRSYSRTGAEPVAAASVECDPVQGGVGRAVTQAVKAAQHPQVVPSGQVGVEAGPSTRAPTRAKAAGLPGWAPSTLARPPGGPDELQRHPQRGGL